MKNTKKFERSTTLAILSQTNGRFDLQSTYLKGKEIPAYPNDNVNTYTLKLVAGTLTWVQDT